jgi:diguanylate cyclase (GGDEF)-like protein/PAS domain S-box-containing protein
MTLRQKTLLASCLAVLLLLSVVAFSANQILLGGFADVEIRETQSSLGRARTAVENELASLTAFLADWAEWDDSYEFVANRSPEYIKKNLTLTTFQTQRLQLLVIIDNRRNIIYGSIFDPRSQTFTAIPVELQQHFQTESPLLSAPRATEAVRGLIVQNGTPWLIASRPIIDSERRLPPRGWLIVGRAVNETLRQQLESTTQLSLAFHPVTATDLPTDIQQAAKQLSTNQPALVAAMSETRIAGYALLTDLYGQLGVILRTDAPRDAFLQGKRTVQYFVLLIIGLGIFFTLVYLMMLERTVLARLSSLGRQVSQIGLQSRPSLRVDVSGQDELSLLAGSINRMLQSLETAQSELLESEAATSALLAGMPDSLLRIDKDGLLLDYKTGRDRVFAAPAKMLAGNSIDEAFPPRLTEKIMTGLRQVLETGETHWFEHETSVNKRPLFLEVRLTPSGNNEVLAVIRDLTEKRELEESLKFANVRDPLTGLLNRDGWEQQLAARKIHLDETVAVIVCAVDGLQLINESLGQDWGDQILKSFAVVLRSCLPLDSLIARTGHDEFTTLMLVHAGTDLQPLCQTIRDETDKISLMDDSLRFSIAVGHAAAIPSVVPLTNIQAQATARMRRDKLRQSQFTRERFFQSLQAALATRDFVTHQHAARLWALCQLLAKQVKLPQRRLRELKLLAQYHDIGKVGIPDHLLFKESRLTDGEMDTMRLHVEIGHRIAQSIPELAPMADLLLKHHEWWNGKGYPLGLRETEIPLECRIFSIVDAFDAMTHDRPGRTACSAKEAAAELRKCAGSQFDPHLVTEFFRLLGEES